MLTANRRGHFRFRRRSSLLKRRNSCVNIKNLANLLSVNSYFFREAMYIYLNNYMRYFFSVPWARYDSVVLAVHPDLSFQQTLYFNSDEGLVCSGLYL